MAFDAHTTLNQHLPTHFNTDVIQESSGRPTAVFLRTTKSSTSATVTKTPDLQSSSSPTKVSGSWQKDSCLAPDPVGGVILLVHDRDVARTILVRFVQLNMTKLTKD